MRTITMHRLQDLVRLHRLGTGAREVARLLGMSPNTERDYRLALGEAGLLEGGAPALVSASRQRARSGDGIGVGSRQEPTGPRGP